MLWHGITTHMNWTSASRGGGVEMQPKIFKYRWNCCVDTGFVSFNGSGYAAGAILGCKGSDCNTAQPHLVAASTTGRGIGMGSNRVASSCIFETEGNGKQGKESGKTRSECECRMSDDKSALSSFRLSFRTAYIVNYLELSRCDRGANTKDIICCLFRVGV